MAAKKTALTPSHKKAPRQSPNVLQLGQPRTTIQTKVIAPPPNHASADQMQPSGMRSYPAPPWIGRRQRNRGASFLPRFVTAASLIVRVDLSVQGNIQLYTPCKKNKCG